MNRHHQRAVRIFTAFTWVLFIFTCVAAVASDALIGYTLTRQLGTGSYLAVEGRVTRCEVGGEDIDFEFEYTAEGRDYKGTQIGYLDNPFHSNAHRYPAGTRVTVYYHPKDPADAVVVTSPGFSAYAFPLGMALVANLMAVAFWYFGRFIRRKLKQSFPESKTDMPPASSPFH